MKAIILTLMIASTLFSQSFKITGFVFNDETKEPISYVNIRIAGTTQGSSSNLEGKFLLTVQSTKVKLIITVVGYKRKEIELTDFKSEIKIGLKSEPIQFMEIVVGSDEDPAYRIVREAIKRKDQNRAGLNSLEYDLFSKDIFLSAGEVAMVTERFSTGYYKSNKPEKIITHSVHISENEKKNALKFSQNILDKIYVDFTRDTLTIVGNKVFLPLAKNAFDWYDYKLVEVKQSGSVHECFIQVIPKSKIQPLLMGKIVIEDSTYSLKRIELKNNDGLRFPYVNDLNVSFIQNKDRFEKYWLPTYFKVESGLKLSFGGLIGTEAISMNQVSMFTNYKINPVIPDSIYKLYSTIESDSSKDSKYKFIKATELSRTQIDSLRPIPLTVAEVKAYNELDSSKTVVTQLKFTGLLSGLATEAIKNDQNQKSGSGFFKYVGSVFKYLNFRDNRVDGILVGAKYNDSFFKNSLSINSNLGYAFGRKMYEGSLLVGLKVKWETITGIEFGLFDEAEQWQLLNPYPDIVNGVNVLFGFDDQFNYYRSSGFSIGLNNKLGKDISSTIRFIFDKQESLSELKYQSIFTPYKPVRLNPQIVDGNDSKISINILLGKSPHDYQPMLQDGLIVQLDFSNPVFVSDFNYKRVRVISQFTTSTIYKELFSSPYFVFGFEVGAVLGDYGPQHTITPNTALNIYSPFLSFKGLAPYEYVGDKLIALHVEHNWRTIPYQAIGLDFLTDLNIDVMTGFSILKMWNESSYFRNQSADKIYWEGYLSFGKIFGVGRINFSYGSNNNFVVRVGLSTVL
ncbi:MAG: DUF5686 family protein [Melioribacteraceae bacterium]